MEGDTSVTPAVSCVWVQVGEPCDRGRDESSTCRWEARKNTTVHGAVFGLQAAKKQVFNSSHRSILRRESSLSEVRLC